MEHDGPRRRPLALQPDGDLWPLMDTLVRQRGINSTCIRWTNGHVTLRQLDAGFSARDAVYNSYADKAADKARTLPTLQLQHEILELYGRKQQKLVVVLMAILKRLARVAKAANLKLEHFAKEQAIVDIEAPIFQYSDRAATAVRLSFLNAPSIDLLDCQALCSS